MDRGAWWVMVHGVTRVRHDLAAIKEIDFLPPASAPPVLSSGSGRAASLPVATAPVRWPLFHGN